MRTGKRLDDGSTPTAAATSRARRVKQRGPLRQRSGTSTAAASAAFKTEEEKQQERILRRRARQIKYTRRKYAENPEKYREKSRQWRQQVPGGYSKYIKEYRARRKGTQNAGEDTAPAQD